LGIHDRIKARLRLPGRGKVWLLLITGQIMLSTLLWFWLLHQQQSAQTAAQLQLQTMQHQSRLKALQSDLSLLVLSDSSLLSTGFFPDHPNAPGLNRARLLDHIQRDLNALRIFLLSKEITALADLETNGASTTLTQLFDETARIAALLPQLGQAVQELEELQSHLREAHEEINKMDSLLVQLLTAKPSEQLNFRQLNHLYLIHTAFKNHQLQLLSASTDAPMPVPTNPEPVQSTQTLQDQNLHFDALISGIDVVPNLALRRSLINLQDKMADSKKYRQWLTQRAENQQSLNRKLTQARSDLAALGSNLALWLENLPSATAGTPNTTTPGIPGLVMLVLFLLPWILMLHDRQTLQSADDNPVSGDSSLKRKAHSLDQDRLRARNRLIHEIQALQEGKLYVTASTDHPDTRELAQTYNQGISRLRERITALKDTLAECQTPSNKAAEWDLHRSQQTKLSRIMEMIDLMKLEPPFNYADPDSIEDRTRTQFHAAQHPVAMQNKPALGG
jgi:hypothetical protein